MQRTRLAALVAGGMLVLSMSATANDDMQDKMKKMDANGDGSVTAAEHAAGAKAMFGKLDANGDGYVTAAEMDAAHAAKDKSRDMDRMSSADKIKAIDTNGDGRLSAAEHEAGARSMFAKGDANGDGSLDAGEMQAAHRMMKQHGSGADGNRAGDAMGQAQGMDAPPEPEEEDQRDN